MLKLYFFTGTDEKVINTIQKVQYIEQMSNGVELCRSVGREDRCQTKLNEVKMSDVDRII
jgi:hypothetical protein